MKLVEGTCWDDSFSRQGKGVAAVTYRLVLHRWLPPLIGAAMGRHWSIAHRLKKKCAEMLAIQALVQGVPRATGKRRVSLMVTLAKGQRQFDKDAPQKLLLDALARAGLILHDGPGGLDGQMQVTFRRGPATESEILLEDVR